VTRIGRMTGRSVVLEPQTDSSLIGGVVAQVGTTLGWTAACAHSSSGLRQELKKRALRNHFESRRSRAHGGNPGGRDQPHPPRADQGLTARRSRSARRAPVLSTGDGIARVYGLEGVMAGELVEFSPRPDGTGAEPGRGLRRHRADGRAEPPARRGLVRPAPGPHRRRARRPTRWWGRVLDALGEPIDWQRPGGAARSVARSR